MASKRCDFIIRYQLIRKYFLIGTDGCLLLIIENSIIIEYEDIFVLRNAFICYRFNSNDYLTLCFDSNSFLRDSTRVDAQHAF